MNVNLLNAGRDIRNVTGRNVVNGNVHIAERNIKNEIVLNVCKSLFYTSHLKSKFSHSFYLHRTINYDTTLVVI